MEWPALALHRMISKQPNACAETHGRMATAKLKPDFGQKKALSPLI